MSTSSSAASASAATAGIQVWEIVIMAGAAVMLIASFLGFYKVSSGVYSKSWSAWSNAFSLFPAVLLAVLATVAVGAMTALARFAPQVKLPGGDRDWTEYTTTAVVLSAITVIAFGIRSLPGGLSRGVGAYLMLIAAIAAVVGVVLRSKDAPAVAPGAASTSHSLQPFGIVVIAGAAIALIGSFLTVFGSGSAGVSAWGSGMMPAITLPAILAVVAAVLIALDQMGTLNGGMVLLGLTLRRWARALGIDAGALMICYLIGNAGINSSGGRSIGFWLMLLGALGVGVAAVMGDRLTFPTGSTTSSPSAG